MLDYFKIILAKMSFSKTLQRKEYRKSFQYLTPSEQQALKEWIRAQRPWQAY